MKKIRRLLGAIPYNRVKCFFKKVENSKNGCKRRIPEYSTGHAAFPIWATTPNLI
jgi:hypothetical protein